MMNPLNASAYLSSIGTLLSFTAAVELYYNNIIKKPTPPNTRTKKNGTSCKKKLRILLVSPITFLYYLNKNMVSRASRSTLRGIHKKKIRLLSQATEPKVPITRCSIMSYSNQSLSNKGFHKIISSSSQQFGSMVICARLSYSSSPKQSLA